MDLRGILQIVVITLLVLLAMWWDKKHPFPIPVIRNGGSTAAHV